MIIRKTLQILLKIKAFFSTAWGRFALAGGTGDWW
jgi:hypothetical protein